MANRQAAPRKPGHGRVPPRARDFRRMAREALEGHWLRMALVTLVFFLLTGTLLSTSEGVYYDAARPVRGEPGVSVRWTGTFGPFRYTFESPKDMNRSEYWKLPFLEKERLEYEVGWGMALNALLPAIAALGVLSVAVRLFTPVLELGRFETAAALYRGEAPHPSMLFLKMRFFGKALWLAILRAFFTGLWMLLFIVPGVIAFYRYSMAFYILWKNPDMRAIDALRESKRLMRGHKGRLFCLNFSYFGWMLPCMVIGWYLNVKLAPLLLPMPFAPLPGWLFTLASVAFVNSYIYAGDFAFFLDLEKRQAKGD